MGEILNNEETQVKIEKVEQKGEANIYPQVLCAFIASLGLITTGMVGTWTGTALTKLNKDFEMTTTDTSLVVSLFSYGSLVGSILSGKGMDVFGRRKMLLSIGPIATCGWLVIGFANSVYMVHLGRFLGGISFGVAFTASSIYTSETCQPSLRGRLGSLSIISLAVGIQLSYLLGGLFPWKTSALLCIIPAVIFFIGLFFVPETPYWLLLKGRDEEAAASLRRLRGPNYPVRKEMTEINRKIHDVGTNITYKELLKRRTTVPLLVALYVQTLQQFCGANIIMTYTSTIFESAQSSIDSQMATIFAGVSQLAGSIFTLFIVDKFGRKVLLALSVFLCGVFIALLGGYYQAMIGGKDYGWPAWTPMLFLVCYLFVYCLGCRSVSYLIGSEIFNTSVRSRAQSILVCYNRVLSLIVYQAYPYLISGLGESVVFFMYGVLCLIFTVGTIFFVPETKGKSLEEIQEYFEEIALTLKRRKEKNKILESVEL